MLYYGIVFNVYYMRYMEINLECIERLILEYREIN